MSDSSRDKAIAFYVRLYAFLLLSYPHSFRRAYGAQMTQVFRDCCRDAYRRRGVSGLPRLWLATCRDLAISALAERIVRIKSFFVHERLPLMSSPALSCVPAGAPRRRVALALDLAIGPLSFLALYIGTDSLIGTLHAEDGWGNTLVSITPTAFWLAVVLALAWRGQTVGQALLDLRWVADDGRPARWRPAGELQFWCAGLALLLTGGFILLAYAWVGLTWVLTRVFHIGLGLPGIWGNGVVPGLSLAAILVLGLMWLARRRPAHLARIAR